MAKDMNIVRAERHTKVWGEEQWIVNNGRYCGKKLILRQGWQCSLHYHKVKEETFYVQSGLVRMELLDAVAYEQEKPRVLEPGDAVHILPGKLHRFAGLADSVIFEFSTHHDEEDSYRVPGELSGRIRPAFSGSVSRTV